MGLKAESQAEKAAACTVVSNPKLPWTCWQGRQGHTVPDREEEKQFRFL